jgi:hypothetical protein
MSDGRLPLAVPDVRACLMLEGMDAQVHFVYYRPEIEAARSRSGLRANSFVRLRS